MGIYHLDFGDQQETSPRMLAALKKFRLEQEKKRNLDEIWLYDELVGYTCMPHREITLSVVAAIYHTVSEELTTKSQRPYRGPNRGDKPEPYLGSCICCEE